jgi:photosystem II stability/assembly factor-like uncharacterized protein
MIGSRRYRQVLPLLLLLSFVAFGQPTQWTVVGPGGGGAFYNPAFNPYQAGGLFVASDMSGLYASTDYGTTWSTQSFQNINGGSIGGRVEPTDDPTVFYTLGVRGDLRVPAKSTDGGHTWSYLASDPTGGDAYALFADPTNQQRLLVSDYSNVFFSSDGGATFFLKFSSNVNGNGCHIAGAYFDGSAIVVGTNAGVFASTDGGMTFSGTAPLGIPATESMVSFAGARAGVSARFFCVTAKNTNVYAGITGADYASYISVYEIDQGVVTWTQRTIGIPAGSYPWYVSMARNDISTAYLAGTENGAPMVLKTTDGGQSWNRVFLTANNQNIFTGWSGDGGDRGWGYGEYALGLAVALNDADHAALTDLGFVHVTTDGGTHWHQAYVNPLDENPENAQTPQGKAYRSSGLENTSAWHLLWTDPGNVIGCYTDIRMARSTDNGASWSFNYSGHTLNTMYHAVKHPTNGMIYAATSSVHDLYESTYLQDARIDGGTGRVLSSADGGHTWTVVHDFSHPVVWLALDPNDPNRLYASVVHRTAPHPPGRNSHPRPGRKGTRSSYACCATERSRAVIRGDGPGVPSISRPVPGYSTPRIRGRRGSIAATRRCDTGRATSYSIRTIRRRRSGTPGCTAGGAVRRTVSADCTRPRIADRRG